MAPPVKSANDESPKAVAKIAKSVAAGLDAPADATRELPFAFTTFSAPPPLNAKNAGASYMKTEGQSWTARHPLGTVLDNNARAAARSVKKLKRRRENGGEAAGEEPRDGYDDEDDGEDNESDMDEDGPDAVIYNNTIVVHMGSSELRVGLATDLNPITLPNCLARRDQLTLARRRAEEGEASTSETDAEVESRVSSTVEALRADLRSIMRNLKLRGVANGKQQAANYNTNVNPEILEEHQDIFAIDWTDDRSIKGDVVIGDEAEKLEVFSSGQDGLADQTPPWKLFYPIKAGHFNFEDYAAHYGPSSARAALLSDLHAVLKDSITSPRELEPTKENSGQSGGHGLGIAKEEWKHYNIALVVPDLYMACEIEALVELFLDDMGFAGIMLQQEAVCATFGAGQSSACVVQVGSSRTSVTCVDEGLVVADSRQLLGYGGQQCSQLFARLLQQANFPYKDFDMGRRLSDRWLADELKERLCTLDPFQLGLIISDFHVRLPNKRAQKYTVRTYDEVIIGAMGFFNPKAFVTYAAPRQFLPWSGADLMGDDDIGGGTTGQEGQLVATQAMRNNVRHLLPAMVVAEDSSLAKPSAATESANATKASTPAPAPVATGLASSPPLGTPRENGGAQVSEQSQSLQGTPAVDDATSSSARNSPVTSRPSGLKETGSAQAGASNAETITVPSGEEINIPHEASKTQLDLAVWNSIIASSSMLNTPAASEERIKRMITNVLCTGGTALLPGLGMAIEARLNNYVAALWTAQNKDINAAPHATVVPPPRDMDPRIVPWKGMAVLTRLDNHVSDMWLLQQEWQMFGMRALRERFYFLP